MKSTFVLSSLAGIITAEQLRFIQLQSVVTQQFTTVYWPDGVTNVDSVAFAHASTFELHELEGKENYWQLRAVKNNNWLSAENGGGSSTITNRTEASAWETFHAVFSTDNTVHLKTHEGFYLGIDGTDSSALVATSQVASDWETFKVIDIPQLQGANLGSWMIPELWMFTEDSELWANSDNATDLWSLCTNLGQEEATRRITKHRDTWFTEESFALMASEGVNHVRLPMGYWDMIETAPYVFGGAEYIDKAIGWAYKYGMSVMIDLHGAPGSQNGNDHSGHSGEINWDTPENIAETVTVLGMMAERWANVPGVWGFELMNEPHWSLSHEVLTDFYRNAYVEIRKYSADTNIVMNSLYGPHDWTAGVMPEPQYRNVFLDLHLYTVWSGFSNAQQYYDEATRWGSEIRSLTPFYPVIVGEMSLATAMNPYPADVKQTFADAEFTSFQENTYGYIFWSQKVENPVYSDGWALELNGDVIGQYYPVTTQVEIVA